MCNLLNGMPCISVTLIVLYACTLSLLLATVQGSISVISQYSYVIKLVGIILEILIEHGILE